MKYLATSIFALILLITPFISRAQSMNIVFVDLQRVIAESDQGKQVGKTLQEEVNRMKKSIDAKQTDLQKLKDSLDKQGTTMSPETRSEKERQYQSKVKELQRMAGDYEAEMKQKEAEQMQKILKQIEEIVRGLGEKEKYTLVLERSQAGILFATSNVDITSKVITIFNDSSKTPKAAAPTNNNRSTKK